MKKTFNWLFALLALVGVFAFTGCSDDDEVVAPPVFPTLPESVDNAQVGQEGTIEFNAYADWTISADQVWVKFKNTDSTDEPAVSISGKAGKQNVTYVVCDDNFDFATSKAVITLSMDNKEATMEISRVAKERSFEFFSIQETEEGFVYTPTDKLELTYNDNAESYHAKYAVRSNYKWVLTVPEWIEIIPSSLSAEANDGVKNEEDLKIYFIDVNKEKATLEDMTGTLDFKDYNGGDNAPVLNSIPVSCKGTTSWNRILGYIPEMIEFTGEGKFVNPDMGIELDAVNLSTLTAKGQEYQFILLPKNGEWYGVVNMMTGELSMDATALGWFGVDPSSFRETEEYPAFSINHYELWASAASEERHATLLAVPTKVAETVGEDYNGYVTEDGSQIKSDYQQYVLAEISQGASASTELEFTMGSMLPDGVEGITIEPMPEEELNIYSGDFGVQAGYVVTFNNFNMYTSSTLKLGNVEGSCAPAMTTPDTALYDPDLKQGWLIISGDSGFQGFMFDFTNEFEPFTGSREATVVLMDPDTCQSHVVIRVVQNADKENSNQ